MGRVTRGRGRRAQKAVLLARFVRARWGYRFRSRARFDAWQARRIRSLLRRLETVPFYAGTHPRRLDDLPVTDKSTLLGSFDDLNTRGVRLADALAVALEAERTRDFSPTVDGDLAVGLSSGTSGRRGVFLVSPRERMLWAGTVLARVLDRRSLGRLLRPWQPPLEIAFFLRAGGTLYESVGSSRIHFTFFDLTLPPADHLAVIGTAGAPAVEVLVAPASVLRSLAEAAERGETALRPRLVVSVAEVLEPETVDAVRRAWGVRPRQVYQATEGLLALSCERGALHLNEESVLIERLYLDAHRRRFTPLVTDFDRRTQIIARHALDDVLRIDPEAPERCACGRVTTVLTAVDGRADAVLRLPSLDGRALVDVYPDAVRQAMARGSASYADWRIRQTGVDVHVAFADPAPDAADRAAAALTELFARYGCAAAIVEEPWPPVDPAAKVRRIVREGLPS